MDIQQNTEEALQMSNLVLYTADDFETSDMPVKDFTGVYAWLTGYKIIGLMDLDIK